MSKAQSTKDLAEAGRRKVPRPPLFSQHPFTNCLIHPRVQESFLPTNIPTDYPLTGFLYLRSWTRFGSRRQQQNSARKELLLRQQAPLQIQPNARAHQNKAAQRTPSTAMPRAQKHRPPQTLQTAPHRGKKHQPSSLVKPPRSFRTGPSGCLPRCGDHHPLPRHCSTRQHRPPRPKNSTLCIQSQRNIACPRSDSSACYRILHQRCRLHMQHSLVAPLCQTGDPGAMEAGRSALRRAKSQELRLTNSQPLWLVRRL